MKRSARCGRRAAWLVVLIALAALTSRAVTSPDRVAFADGLFSRGLHDMALQEYEALLALRPPPAALDTILFRAADCHRALGRAEPAIALYGRVISEFPQGASTPRARFRRGEALAGAGKYTEALGDFRTLATASAPADLLAASVYWQGYCAERAGQPDEASKAYRRIVAEFGDTQFFSFAAVALADLLQRTGAAHLEAADLYLRASRAPSSPRVGAESLFQLGDLAYRANDFATAAHYYEQLLKRYPDDERSPQARLQAAWAFLRTQRPGDALKLCDDAAAAMPAGQRADWRYLRANCERQLQRLQAARDSYAALLAEDPGHALASAALYEQALVAFEQKDYLAVVASAPQAAAHPAAEDFLWIVAESQSALGRRPEALQTYRLLSTTFPQGARTVSARFQEARLRLAAGEVANASDLFREVAQQAGTNAIAADAFFQAGLSRARLQRLEEALQDFDVVVSRFPSFPDLDRALYEKAQAEVTLARDAEARATLDRLLKTYGDRAVAGPAHYLLGVLLERGGDPAGSDAQYRAALEKPGAKSIADQINFRRASLLQQQGKAEEAARILQSLIGTSVLTNMSPQLLEWLARFHLQAGRPADAEAAARVLVQRADTPVWRQMGWYLAGRACQQLGRPTDARQAYEEALKVDARTREGVESALFLGRVALETKDYPLAATCFSRAAEMASGDDVLDIRAQSYFGLGQAARAQEKWEDASRYFLSVSVLFDDRELAPEALFRAAEAFERLQRVPDRDRTLQELRQRYPDSTWSRSPPAQ